MGPIQIYLRDRKSPFIFESDLLFESLNYYLAALKVSTAEQKAP